MGSANTNGQYKCLRRTTSDQCFIRLLSYRIRRMRRKRWAILGDATNRSSSLFSLSMQMTWVVVVAASLRGAVETKAVPPAQGSLWPLSPLLPHLLPLPLLVNDRLDDSSNSNSSSNGIHDCPLVHESTTTTITITATITTTITITQTTRITTTITPKHQHH